jgi:hypothetical protein
MPLSWTFHELEAFIGKAIRGAAVLGHRKPLIQWLHKNVPTAGKPTRQRRQADVNDPLPAGEKS